MTRRTLRLAAALLAALALSSVLVGGVAAHDRPGPGRDLVRAAKATARFHSLEQAGRAGYAAFPVGVPLHDCIASFDNTGAMGFHYLNGSLLTTDLDPTKPQVLVYAPDRHGRLHLVALEFVVFQADWIAAHGNTMPSLFGQMFMATGDNNRFQIPAFFSLHVWLWKFNPSGLFAPFNPNVSCDPGKGRQHEGGEIREEAAVRDVAYRAARAGFTCPLGSIAIG